ncbi:MAG: hypothetical protein ACK5PC_21685 [Cyclobacteriaceae bacterium]|nr:hypothetical protein [Flammeovirgaceae bacterium]
MRKMYGSKKESQSPESTTAAGEPKTKSRRARGLDFGTMAYQFAKLVKTISAEPSYHVNEPELSLEGIKQKADMLVSLNEAVYQITAKLNSARGKRNELLYGTGNNLVNTGMAVKHYVRSTFGPKSNEYAEVKKIQFTKPTT